MWWTVWNPWKSWKLRCMHWRCPLHFVHFAPHPKHFQRFSYLNACPVEQVFDGKRLVASWRQQSWCQAFWGLSQLSVSLRIELTLWHPLTIYEQHLPHSIFYSSACTLDVVFSFVTFNTLLTIAVFIVRVVHRILVMTRFVLHPALWSLCSCLLHATRMFRTNIWLPCFWSCSRFVFFFWRQIPTRWYMLPSPDDSAKCMDWTTRYDFLYYLYSRQAAFAMARI